MRISWRSPRSVGFVGPCAVSGAAADGLSVEGSGGNKDGSGSSGGGGGDGGAGGDEGRSPAGDTGVDPAVAALLASANRAVGSFPKDVAAGLTSGRVGPATTAQHIFPFPWSRRVNAMMPYP